MAKAPLCKLCGSAHWSNQPHKWAGEPKANPAPSAARSAPKTAPKIHQGDQVMTEQQFLSSQRVKQDAPNTVSLNPALAEYIALQRSKNAAYMRDYRAKKKGKSDG